MRFPLPVIGAICCFSILGRLAADPVREWPTAFLHLNGYTQHFSAPGANNLLYGLGATWGIRRAGRMRLAWEADAFRDSGRKLSLYAGHSWTLPLPFAEVGVTGALMYHRNFFSQNRWGVLPVALPFVEAPLSRAATVRLYYIPPVRSKCDHQVSLQLLVPLNPRPRSDPSFY